MKRFFWVNRVVRGLLPVCLVAVFVFTASPGSADTQNPFSFIAIGDTPYSDVENQRLNSHISPKIKAVNPPFVVHYGDLKSGGEACTEELMTTRRDQVYGLLPGRVFYTPGDNDWTDCDRYYLDSPVSELASLNFLRQLFFDKPMDLPESWKYSRQSNFPENARWTKDGVFFVTVHLVATNNGRVDIQQDDIELALSLVEARDQANRVWLEESFKVARDADAQALVVVTQADVTSPEAGGPCTGTNRMNCDAFQTFRENLKLLAGDFAERDKPRKPVLLLHGDSYPYCMDRTFGGKKAPNLWRLNAWGDFRSPADATVVTVQSGHKQAPFSAVTLLGQEVPADRCD